jgi:hypothetical protein
MGFRDDFIDSMAGERQLADIRARTNCQDKWPKQMQPLLRLSRHRANRALR